MTEIRLPKGGQTSFRVRFAETDSMGIVHHSRYLVWFEEARSASLRVRGTSYADFVAEGFALIVSEVKIRYVSPAYYDRLITIQCHIDKIQSRKMTFSYTILEAESKRLIATGITEHICVDSNAKVTRIPKKWQDIMGDVVE